MTPFSLVEEERKWWAALRGFLLVVLGAAGGMVVMAWGMEHVTATEPPAAQAVVGIERRIHLSIEGKWDSDKRRKFICVEEHP